MVYTRLVMRMIAGSLAMLCIALGVWTGVALAAEPGQSQTSGGLTVYLGVLPAELIKGPGPHSGDKPMHGRIPKGPHEFHIVIAIFEAGTRISDATVTANVSGLELSGTQKALEPTKLADTTTYGAFFNLTRDIYTIRVTVERPGARLVTFGFKYDHRR